MGTPAGTPAGTPSALLRPVSDHLYDALLLAPYAVQQLHDRCLAHMQEVLQATVFV